MRLKDAEIGRKVRVKTKYLRWYEMEGKIVDVKYPNPNCAFPIQVYLPDIKGVMVFEGRNLEYV